MNVDIHTLALAHEDTVLLKRLLNRELPIEIHVIVASEMDSRSKSEALETLFHDFRTLDAMLTWQATDTEAGRALRQIDTSAVMRLRELIVGNIEDAIQEVSNEDIGVGMFNVGIQTLTTLDRALKLPVRADMPTFPAKLENPQARA